MATVAPHPLSITRVGRARLAAELERLVSERPRLAASGPGGRSPQLAATAALERRIAQLREVLESALIVDPPTDGCAGLGHTVTIRFDDGGTTTRYELVGTLEVDPAAGRISADSPIGRAVLGRRPGDVAEVQAPSGIRRVELLAVELPAQFS